MFYVNDDDTDGLFRKAAENYDINAEQASDFNAVQKALNEEGGPGEQEQEKKKKRFPAFWWLLLLPFLGLMIWNKQIFTSQNNTVSNDIIKSDTVVGSNQQGGNNNVAELGQEKNTGVPKTGGSIRQKKTGITGENKYALKQANSERVGTEKNKSLPTDHSIANNLPLDGITNDDNANNDASINPDSENLAATRDTVTNMTTADPGLKSNPEAALPVQESVVQNKQKNKKTSPSKNSFFYAGLSGAVDVSFVKFQKTTSPGISAGIVAGYRINKKWQVETGLLFDKKNYYTSGQYFDKSNVPYLRWVDLKSVSGNCNMLEIPLNVRFNFGEKKKHVWFASTGVSSYLMTKEYYHYHYIANGSYNQSEHTYEQSSNEWFAVMNVSAGYELKTGAKTFVRFEPYYKIPLKGVGTGSLPLSSAGLNIAITRQIP